MITCPSCGAPHDIHNPGIITIVCEYCGNAVYWDSQKIQNAGKQSILPEGFSRFYRGATGKLLNKSFFVLGRVRYSFGNGFWDEWFLEIENSEIVWLTEDNHEFAYQTKIENIKIPDFSTIRIGSRLNFNNTDFIIQEIGQAECMGVEGDLPIYIQTGEKYPFADGSSPDGKYTIGIEYDENPPTVFYGRWINYASIKLDDEGLDWQ